jgi:hypothetical protein
VTNKNQNPDPHQDDKSNPDPHQGDADPQRIQPSCIEETPKSMTITIQSDFNEPNLENFQQNQDCDLHVVDL